MQSMSNKSPRSSGDAKTAISVIPPTPPTGPVRSLQQQPPLPPPVSPFTRALPISSQPAINLSYIPRRPTGQIVQIPFTPSTYSNSNGSVSPRSAAPANSPANSSVTDSIDVSPLPTDAASYSRSNSSSLVHRPRVQASGPRPQREPSPPQSYSANNPPRALPMDLTPCDCPMCQPTRFDTTSVHSFSVDSFPVNSSIPECDCGCELESREHVTSSVAASLSSPIPQRLHPSLSITSGEGISVHSADSSHSSTSSSSEAHGVLVTSSLSMDKLALHQRLASLDFERRQHALHAQSPQQRNHSRGSSLHNMTAATAALLCISAARERINEEEEEASPSLNQPAQSMFAADDCDLETVYRNATVVPPPNADSEASPENDQPFPAFDRPSDLLVRRRFSDSGLLVHTNAAAAAAIAARLRLRGHAAACVGDNENSELYEPTDDGECTCGGQSPSFLNPANGTNANTTVNNTRAPSPSEQGMRSYVASVSTSPCGRFGVESADVSRRTSPSANGPAPLGSSNKLAPAPPSSSGRKVFTFEGPLVSFYENLEKQQQHEERIAEEALDLSKTPPTGDSFSNPLYAYGSPATRKSPHGHHLAPARHIRELSRVTEYSGVSADKQSADDQWAVRLRPPMPDSKAASKDKDFLLGVPTPNATHDHTTPNAALGPDDSDATWHRVQAPANIPEQQRTNYTYLTGMDQHDWSLLVKMYRNMPPTV